jgi:hypothetical protein
LSTLSVCLYLSIYLTIESQSTWSKNWTELKEKIDNSTIIIMMKFNTCLLIMDRTIREIKTTQRTCGHQLTTLHRHL